MKKRHINIMTTDDLRIFRWKLLAIEPCGHNTNRILYHVNMQLYERTKNMIYLLGTSWRLGDFNNKKYVTNNTTHICQN